MAATDKNLLARLLDQPEEQIDLGRAALLLARTEYPDLDLDAEVARLDALSAEAARSVLSHQDTGARVTACRHFLAEVCGFHGNEHDYYDPQNSFLNQVLDRRTGIPITLSVVYMEVGRRLGLPLYGVGLPGHFLVKWQDSRSVIFLDPFHGGCAVSTAGCRAMVDRIYEGRMEFRNEFLAAVTKKQIILRMLSNLRGIYLHHRQLRKALAVIEMILAISPASPEDLKQRGMLHFQLHNFRQAREDLEGYLFLNPRASDAEEVQQSLNALKRTAAMLN